MLKETPVKVVKVNLYCDKCGEEMVSKGIAYCTNPPQYPYHCPKCNYEMITYESYPTIKYIENNG